MDEHHHTLNDLFDQLGLEGSPAGVEAFVRAHRPLPEHLKLADAPFWSPSQATFLREKVKEDADWAVVVDSLDAMLRQPDSAHA